MNFQRRVLLLATTTGYQTRAFGAAATRLGIRLLLATDRCDQLDDPWSDAAVPIRFHQEPESVTAVLEAVAQFPIDGLLAVGDRPTVLAAQVAEALRLPGHPPAAARAARSKRLSRERFRAAGLPVPEVWTLDPGSDPGALASRVRFPCVAKPLALSGSRGVIRVDTPAELSLAVERIRRLLAGADIQAQRDPELQVVQVERFIPGREFALEGLLEHGRFHPLALFDKPDPLDGPYFEETLYVTPSRAPHAQQERIVDAVIAGSKALGLRHGPVHAECRVNAEGVFLLEIAARPIGGLCAGALTFERAHAGMRDPSEAPESIGFEELLLRHALGEPVSDWARETSASGVMMVPIPRGGVYAGVEGVEQALRTPYITGVQVTAQTGQTLVPLPEGSSYLGFVFARAPRAPETERALREAHAQLRFRIVPSVALLPV